MSVEWGFAIGVVAGFLVGLFIQWLAFHGN